MALYVTTFGSQQRPFAGACVGFHSIQTGEHWAKTKTTMTPSYTTRIVIRTQSKIVRQRVRLYRRAIRHATEMRPVARPQIQKGCEIQLRRAVSTSYAGVSV